MTRTYAATLPNGKGHNGSHDRATATQILVNAIKGLPGNSQHAWTIQPQRLTTTVLKDGREIFFVDNSLNVYNFSNEKLLGSLAGVNRKTLETIANAVS